MPWTRLDDGFHSHPLVVGLSDVAYRLFVQSLNWSVSHSTDGELPSLILPIALPTHRPTARAVAATELVGVGLWTADGDHWLIRNFDRYQETKDTVQARRQKWAEQKRGQRQGVHHGQDEDSTGTHPTPSQPIPKENYLDPLRGLTLAIEEAAKDPKVRNPRKAGTYRFNQDPIKYNARYDLQHTELPDLGLTMPPAEDWKANAKKAKAELRRRNQ